MSDPKEWTVKLRRMDGWQNAWDVTSAPLPDIDDDELVLVPRSEYDRLKTTLANVDSGLSHIYSLVWNQPDQETERFDVAVIVEGLTQEIETVLGKVTK